MQARWVIGMMSGTSLDGVDAAALKTDGQMVEAFGPTRFRAYAPEERAELRRALDVAAHRCGDDPAASLETPELRRASEIVTAAHLELSRELRDAVAEEVALVGFHGQTVWHDPANRRTVQIGDATALATALGVDVIADFRSADVAAGGEGAPFAPFFHFALAKRAGATAPLAFLNLGGVGNVTWIDPTAIAPDAPGAMLAFDTGPANAMIDDWMASRTGVARDQDGAAAAAGRAHDETLAALLAHPYFDQPPPKSLDRNAFAGSAARLAELSTEDGAATLTAFTVASVARAVEPMPSSPERWIVCGGGRRNPTIMRRLAERLSAPVEPVEALGLDGDMIEANAFAHLAMRSALGLSLSAPGTTGAPAPLTGGVRVRAPI